MTYRIARWSPSRTAVSAVVLSFVVSCVHAPNSVRRVSALASEDAAERHNEDASPLTTSATASDAAKGADVILITPDHPPDEAAMNQARYMLDFDKADVVEVARFVAQATGRSFLVPARVRGRITIVTQAELSTDGLYAAFIKSLAALNLAVTLEGPHRVIVSLPGTSDADSKPLLTMEGESGPRVENDAPEPEFTCAPQADGEPLAGIERKGEDAYQITRARLDDTLSNQSDVTARARVSPSFVNGTAHGIKLFRICPGSIFEPAGLQEGDVIRRVDGIALDTPDNVLAVLSRLEEVETF
jgi:hypothetical protein